MKEQLDNIGKKIAKVTNNQKKFIIIFDDDKKIELNETAYLSCGYLYEGKKLTNKQLAEIIYLSKLQEGINYINNLLSRNLYTSHELIYKLQNTKSYCLEDAIKIVNLFINDGKINDREYAINLIEELKEKGKSKEYAYQKLNAKKFNYDLIKELLLDYEENYEAIYNLIDNCNRRYSSKPYEAKKKSIYNYLISKGFNHDKAYSYVERYYDSIGGKNKEDEEQLLIKNAEIAYRSALLRGKDAYDKKQKFIRYLLSKGFKYSEIVELLEGEEYEFN